MEIIKSFFIDLWPIIVFLISFIYGIGRVSSRLEERLKSYKDEQLNIETSLHQRLSALENKVNQLDTTQASTTATLNAMFTQITSISTRVDTIISHLWNKDK